MNTQNFIGIPPRFWDDDYVLGFIGFCAAFHMNKTSNISSSAQEKGEALVEVFTNLSHSNGLPLVRKYNELTTSKSNQDFEQGADNAATWIFYMYEFLKDEDTNQDVIDASSNGELDDRDKIAFKLLNNLYFEVLKSRFELK